MEVRLHIGAHRTGSTRLQGLLRRRQVFLARRGIAAHGPRAIRSEHTDGHYLPALLPGIGRHLRSEIQVNLATLRQTAEADGRRRLVLSEENLAGRIDSILRSGVLYGSIRRRLALVGPLLASDRVTVLFSVRGYAGFFASLYAHRTRQRPMPPFDRYRARFLALRRRWPAVVADITAVFPKADVLVWPFEDLAGRNEAAYRHLIGEDTVSPVPEDAPPALPSPSAAAVAALNRLKDRDVAARGAVAKDLSGPAAPRFDPWTAVERADLDAAYAEDLARLAAMDITFATFKQPARGQAAGG